MVDRPITEVFHLLCEVGVANGGMNIKDLPGCWTYQSGIDFIALNGHEEETVADVPGGGIIKVPPYGGVMFSNGWLVFMGNPFGGTVMMMTEGELIQRIQKLIDQKSMTA